MRTIEIPRRAWGRFLSDLGVQAFHRIIRLEVENMEFGDQEMGNLLPLEGLDIELKGSDVGVVEITVGGDTDELTHRIERPTRIYARISDGQEIECLSIEDADGGKTLVFFQEMPLLPEWQEEGGASAGAP